MEASWEDKQRQNGLIIASVVLTVMAGKKNTEVLQQATFSWQGVSCAGSEHG